MIKTSYIDLFLNYKAVVQIPGNVPTSALSVMQDAIEEYAGEPIGVTKHYNGIVEYIERIRAHIHDNYPCPGPGDIELCYDPSGDYRLGYMLMPTTWFTGQGLISVDFDTFMHECTSRFPSCVIEENDFENVFD